MVTNSIALVVVSAPPADIPRVLSDNPTFLDAATFKSPKSLTPPCDDIVTYAIFEVFTPGDT